MAQIVRAGIREVLLDEPGARDAPGAGFHALFLDGRLAVLYTPFDLMSGVNRESNAYARGVTSDDALRIVTNLITYALSN